MPAQPATEGELALVHTPAYIQAIADGTRRPEGHARDRLSLEPAMAERARRSVGATIAACRAALAEGVAANIAGGTHHAYPDRGGGFCVFNDAAVATRLMQAEHARRQREPLRVAIVDLDVHQGNGTRLHLPRRPDRLHALAARRSKNFPFRKEASDLDVDLPRWQRRRRRTCRRWSGRWRNWRSASTRPS